jgi:23S rRNA (uridine2552-2'-O)-methyltransferase
MTRWYTEKKREHFYKEAKKHGYRARSAYKLKQIQKKYHLIQEGDDVLDLGAAPGGWSQVAWEYIGSNGKVIGVDLSLIKPFQDIVFIQGDVTDPSTIEQVRTGISGDFFDVVLSDMAPNISGNYSVDHVQSIYLSTCALSVVEQVLKPHGHFVCKVFMGDTFQEFLDSVKPRFLKVHCYSPPASRKSSSEIYIIGKSFIK